MMRCQFCGVDTSGVERQVESPRERPGGYVAPAWIWKLYNAVAAYWIVAGLFTAAAFSGVFGGRSSFFFVAVGFFWAIVGVGLLARVELARGLANVLSFFKILLAIWGIVQLIVFPFSSGPSALISLILCALDIVSAGLLIFLIGETESHARF
jgi:hypothetical protein